MGILGFIKDVVLLPVDVFQDVTGIGIIKRVVKDDLMKCKTCKLNNKLD